MKVRTEIAGWYFDPVIDKEMWVDNMAGKKLPPWLDKKKKGKGDMPMKGKMPKKMPHK